MELNDKILDASIGMFFSHGIKAVSMDDVAKAVGISKRTLYEHFDSKDALLMGCIELMVKMRGKKMSEMIGGAKSFIELILKGMYNAMEFTQSISSQFFADLEDLNYAGARTSMCDSIGKYRQQIENLIEKGKADGLLRHDVDAKFTAYVMMQGGSTSRIINSEEASQWTPDWIMKQLTTVFIRGMATEKGIRLIDEYIERADKQANKQ